MKAFRFPLDRVLRWRTTQCEMEEAAMSRLTSQRAQLANAIEQIAIGRKQASEAISSQNEVPAAEFQTIAAFQVSMDVQKTRLVQRSRELEQQIANQTIKTAEARRKKKLLEILREGRLTQWTALRNAEDEAAATDSWLTRYVAERYTTENATPPNP